MLYYPIASYKQEPVRIRIDYRKHHFIKGGEGLLAKERIELIRLSQKLKRYPLYAERIGVSVESQMNQSKKNRDAIGKKPSVLSVQ